MRRTLGTAVFSGMIGVTLFGIFLTPVFFYVIDYLSGKHVFASPRVRRFGEAVRNLLTLRFVWLLGCLGWRKVGAPLVRRATASPATRVAVGTHAISDNGAPSNGAAGNGQPAPSRSEALPGSGSSRGPA